MLHLYSRLQLKLTACFALPLSTHRDAEHKQSLHSIVNLLRLWDKRPFACKDSKEKAVILVPFQLEF